MLKKIMSVLVLLIGLSTMPAYALHWVQRPASQNSKYDLYYDTDSVQLLYADGEIKAVYFWEKIVPLTPGNYDYSVALTRVDIEQDKNRISAYNEYRAIFAMHNQKTGMIYWQPEEWKYCSKNDKISSETAKQAVKKVRANPNKIQNHIITKLVDVRKVRFPSTTLH